MALSAIASAGVSTTESKLNSDSAARALQVLEPVQGELMSIKSRADDTLVSIARRYGYGIDNLQLANPGVDPWVPRNGSHVRLPGRYILPDLSALSPSAEQVVVNLPELRMYHINGKTVKSYPIGIGRQNWRTPVFSSVITSKIESPTWTPPKSVRDEALKYGEVLPLQYLPGPDNPLGNHAMRLGNTPFLIHGTNRPSGVGKRVSHGCIRLYPEQIEKFFGEVEIGTAVSIVNQPIKTGWNENELYLEVHPPLAEDQVSRNDVLNQARDAIFSAMIDRQILDGSIVQLVDQQLENVVALSNGIPGVVATVVSSVVPLVTPSGSTQPLQQ